MVMKATLQTSAAMPCMIPYDGRLKMWVTSRTLNFRRQHKDLFQDGSYLPLR